MSESRIMRRAFHAPSYPEHVHRDFQEARTHPATRLFRSFNRARPILRILESGQIIHLLVPRTTPFTAFGCQLAPKRERSTTMSTTPQPTPTPSSYNNAPASPTSADASALENLSQTEQQVLDEYARLLGNLNNLNALLAELSENPSAEILDSLRGLERKTSLVFTLLKASVYSIVLQQQSGVEDEEGGGGMGSLGGSVGG